MTKSKVAQLELVLEDCIKFMEMIPLEAINKGMRWFPSPETIELGRRAIDSINRYVESPLHPLSNS